MNRSCLRGLPLSMVFCVFAGCASVGLGSKEQVSTGPETTQGVRRVPVFSAAPDVPCKYVGVGGVSSEMTIDEPREITNDIKRVLGQLGARRGADAVIMSPDIDIPIAASSGGDPVESLVGRTISVRGVAIEYTEPCPTAEAGSR